MLPHAANLHDINEVIQYAYVLPHAANLYIPYENKAAMDFHGTLPHTGVNLCPSPDINVIVSGKQLLENHKLEIALFSESTEILLLNDFYI